MTPVAASARAKGRLKVEPTLQERGIVADGSHRCAGKHRCQQRGKSRAHVTCAGCALPDRLSDAWHLARSRLSRLGSKANTCI
jgi:hypothetical protein